MTKKNLTIHTCVWGRMINWYFNYGVPSALADADKNRIHELHLYILPSEEDIVKEKIQKCESLNGVDVKLRHMEINQIISTAKIELKETATNGNYLLPISPDWILARETLPAIMDKMDTYNAVFFRVRRSRSNYPNIAVPINMDIVRKFGNRDFDLPQICIIPTLDLADFFAGNMTYNAGYEHIIAGYVVDNSSYNLCVLDDNKAGGMEFEVGKSVGWGIKEAGKSYLPYLLMCAKYYKWTLVNRVYVDNPVNIQRNLDRFAILAKELARK